MLSHMAISRGGAGVSPAGTAAPGTSSSVLPPGPSSVVSVPPMAARASRTVDRLCSANWAMSSAEAGPNPSR